MAEPGSKVATYLSLMYCVGLRPPHAAASPTLAAASAVEELPEQLSRMDLVAWVGCSQTFVGNVS